MVPFIFPKKKEQQKSYENDVLIVNMLTQDKMMGSIVIKNDKNIYKKYITGINDANQFFSTGSSDMCMYQKDLTYKNIIERSIFEIICFISIIMIDIFVSIHCNSKVLFSDSFIYDFFYNFFYNIFNGFIDGFFL
jgi:hypothetical protein